MDTTTTPTAPRRFPNSTAIAALAAAAISTAAVSLVTLNGLKDAVIDASLHNRPVGLATLRQAIGPLDVVLILLAAACLAAMAWMELRHRRYTTLLATLTPAECWVTATILIAWLGHAYLSPGILLGGDIATHITRFLEVARGLDEGHLPDWTNYQYLGTSLLWFTGPLTYVVGGVLNWFVHDAVLTMKILLFTLHVAGGLAFLAFIRRLGLRPVTALVATLAFAGSFAHLHMFLYRGVMPQAFTMLFMMLVFWAADGLLRTRGTRWVNALVFSLATAALILNHQPHALFVGAYLAIFGAVMLATHRWHWNQVPVLVVAGGLAVVTATLAVVPILLEADSTMIDPEGGLFQLQLPTLGRLWNLVRWRNTATVYGADYWSYLGLGILVFGLTGIAALLAGRLPPARRGLAAAALACLAVEFFLYNPVVRDVMFMLLFLGILAAIGLEWLIDTRILTARRLTAASLIVLLDLASTSVQPILRTDKGFLLQAGRYLEQTAPNERVAQLSLAPDGSIDIDMGPKGTALAYDAAIQRIGGNHNMAATRVHNFPGATTKMIETSLAADGTIPPNLRDMLGVFNVSRIICSTATANGCPASFKDTKTDPVLGRYIPIPATPAIFSQRLVEQDLAPGIDKPMLWPVYYQWPWKAQFIHDIDTTIYRFLATEKPDPATSTAPAIPIQQPIPQPLATPIPTDPAHPFDPTIRSYAVTLDHIALRVETHAPGFVQLSHPWFPSTVVTINSIPVQPLRGTIGLIVLPLEPGVSTIELHEGGTTARRISMAISLAGLIATLLAAAALAMHDHRKRRTAGGNHAPDHPTATHV